MLRIANKRNLAPFTGNFGEYLRWRGAFNQTKAKVPVTVDTSLTHSAVWSSVNFISATMAMLPLHPMKSTSQGNEKVKGPQARLTKRPNPIHSRFRWIQLNMAQTLLLGNGHAWIERDSVGRPARLWPTGAYQCQSDMTSEGLFYDIKKGGVFPQSMRVPSEDIVHLVGFGYSDIDGLGAIEHYMKENIGLGIAARDFGSKFFGNGAHTTFALTHPDVIGEEPLQRMREQLAEQIGGTNSLKPYIFEEGMTPTTLTIPPDQAQFLETRQKNRIEIAGMFNLPPIFIGEFERATFSNATQMDQFLSKYVLAHWTTRWEEEMNYKLLTERQRDQGMYYKFNMNAILRGDAKSRADFYKVMMQCIMTPNEIRELEDLPKMPGLDEPLRPVNVVPASESPDGEEEPEEPEEEEPEENPDDDENDDN